MKPTILFTTLALVFTSPTLLAKSELETLRSLCKEQERQIRLLEDENDQLRGGDARSSSKASSTPAPAATAPVASGTSTYTVKAGDSFGKIARKVGTGPERLAKMNGLKLSAIIQPGQTLKVPGASTTTRQTASAPSSSGAASHQVQPGETFYSISKKHGLSTEAVIAANPDIKPSALRPGQVVKLTGGGAPATSMISHSTKSSTASTSSAPARTPAAVPNNIPVSTPPPAPVVERKINPQPVTIDSEITYGDFAANHGTDTERLNALNGLDLMNATVLAKGSELYVPAQP